MRATLLRAAAARSHIDNTGDVISCGTGASLVTTAVGTILVLANPSTTANAARNMCGKGVGTTGHDWFKRGTDGTVLRFSLYRATTALQIDSTSGTLMANTWQMLAVTWDIATLGTCKVYRSLNGQPFEDRTDGANTSLGSGAQSSDAANAQIMFSGRNSATNNGWPGAIQALARSNRALTQAELSAMVRRPWTRMPGLVGLWMPGDEGAPGALVTDWSGNGNHGTYTGTTNMSGVAASSVALFPAPGLIRLLR